MVPASCIFIKGRGFCGRDRKVVVCVEGKSRPRGVASVHALASEVVKLNVIF